MKIIISLVFVFILAGCATGMSYHSYDNVWKLGYMDTQLNEYVYRVSYAGYGIPQSECDEYAIMRAAEITRERGYKYFRLLDEKQSSQASSYYIPGTTISHGQATGVGNSVYVNTTSYSTGIAGTVHRPVSTVTIEILEEKTEAVGVLNAEIIWNSLAKKHGVQSHK